MVDARLLSGVEVLVAVIETGSFVRAAEALGLSDSGVSRAVARLEARAEAAHRSLPARWAVPANRWLSERLP